MPKRPTSVRMTLATQSVIRALLGEPTREVYGLELCELAGLPSGTIHPILARLEGAGWVISHWEEIDPSAEARPRRRYYSLTKDGAEQARHALARAYRSESSHGKYVPGLAGGGA